MINDYLFLMAYDEYSNDSDPGPISSQKWIEAAVDLAAKEVSSKKIILCIAGFGYDWGAKGEAEDVTYQQALIKAKESDADVDFDCPFEDIVASDPLSNFGAGTSFFFYRRNFDFFKSCI